MLSLLSKMKNGQRNNTSDSRISCNNFILLFRAENGKEFIVEGNWRVKKYKSEKVRGNFKLIFSDGEE